MFSFFKKRPKTPEPTTIESAPKDDFEVITNTIPTSVFPSDNNSSYSHSSPYPPLPQPFLGSHGGQLKRYESVTKPTQSTEGIPFIFSKNIGGHNFADILKSQIDGIARNLDEKIANSTTIGYDFQLEKSVISEC